MKWLCGGVGGRAGLGGRGGCEEELKTMGESGVEQVRKAEMIAEIFRFGVKLRERICGAIGGTFSRDSGMGRDSTIDALEQAAGRTLRDFAALVPAGGLMWILAHIRADIRAHFVAKNFPCGRKMAPPDLPHLMH